MSTGDPAPRDTGIDLRPDPSRVVLRFFVPGREDVGPGDSRASAVMDRVLDLTTAQVDAELASLRARFARRHADLEGSFARHAELASVRLDTSIGLSDERFLILGAAFSHEYAVEGAALCNPSIVAGPDPAADGTMRFVMSVRGIGEGHRSSIGFRTGSVSALGEVVLDPAGRQVQVGAIGPGTHHRSVLHRKLHDLDDDHDNAAFVLDALPAQFDDERLADRLQVLSEDAATRRHADVTSEHLLRIAAGSYSVAFADVAELGERVLWPYAADERHGMEDARFVEITDGSAPRYCATYTAFDGSDINQYLLTTEDFRTFTAGPMAGAAARGKGLALFPRQVGGRFVALSRADRETNALAFSDDLRCWDEMQPLQAPSRPWEVLQLGNCGSPVETGAGWLVLTHGVGPMRSYSIGALLLDLDDPTRVLASTARPLLEPGPQQQDGYVPNVVYTCGALAHGDHLLVPYGIGDQRIAMAVFSIAALIDSMEPAGTSPEQCS